MQKLSDLEIVIKKILAQALSISLKTIVFLVSLSELVGFQIIPRLGKTFS